MRLAFAVAFLPSLVLALRKQDEGNDADIKEERVDATVAAHSNSAADSGTTLGAGVVLRERYVLAERIGEEYGPGKVFPHELQRQFSGVARHLGTGSFGDTWKAYDSQLNKDVAVKIFYDSDKDEYLTWRSANKYQQQELNDNAQECSMVQNMMLYSFKHVGSAHICQCFGEHVMDAKGTDRPVFLVLEMCGKELSAVVREWATSGKTNVAQARNFAKQTLEGIAFIEMLTPPLIHHDLKPGNLVVNGDDLKIIDWGGTIKALKANEFGGSVFTPVYAAPEVLEADGRIAFSPPTHSYDVYAIGLIYMEMLCPKISYRQWFNISSRRHVPMSESTIQQWMWRCPDLTKDPSIKQDVELIAKMVSRVPSARPSPLDVLDSPPLKSNASKPEIVPAKITKDVAPAYNYAPVKHVAPAYNYAPVKDVAPAYNYAPVKDVAPAKDALLCGRYKVGQKAVLYSGTRRIRVIVASPTYLRGECYYDVNDEHGLPYQKRVPEYNLLEALPGVNW